MKIDALCLRDFKEHKNLLFFHFSDTFMSQWELSKEEDDDSGNKNAKDGKKLFICNNEINNGGNEFSLSRTLCARPQSPGKSLCELFKITMRDFEGFLFYLDA